METKILRIYNPGQCVQNETKESSIKSRKISLRTTICNVSKSSPVHNKNFFKPSGSHLQLEQIRE